MIRTRENGRKLVNVRHFRDLELAAATDVSDNKER